MTEAEEDPKVRIEKLEKFRPLDVNPNRHTERGLGMLERSMGEDGYTEPMTAAADGEMLSGSARLEVAAQVFGTEAEVLVLEHDGRRPIVAVRKDVPDADDPKARRIIHRANRIPQVDIDLDPVLILALEREDPDLYDDLWSNKEKAILAELAEREARADATDARPKPDARMDAANALQGKWQVQPGEVFEIVSQSVQGQSHRLMCGDSQYVTEHHKLMNGRVADLGICSPPYFLGKTYEEGKDFDDHLWMLKGVADCALSVIKPGGFWFINYGDIQPIKLTKDLTGSDRQCVYPMILHYWQILHVERNMDLYADRIWRKQFARLNKPFWTYHTSIPHHGEIEHIQTWRLPGGPKEDRVHDWDISSRVIWDTSESYEDKPLSRFEAAFPLDIPERALKAHSAPGELIWEPFLGSGTTMVAAERLGRICYGMELDATTCAVALDRLEQMGLDIHRFRPI